MSATARTGRLTPGDSDDGPFARLSTWPGRAHEGAVSQAHPAHAADAGLAERIYGSLGAAFEEDRSMICAQARAIDPSRPMVPLHFDAALLRFRRLLEGRVAD